MQRRAGEPVGPSQRNPCNPTTEDITWGISSEGLDLRYSMITCFLMLRFFLKFSLFLSWYLIALTFHLRLLRYCKTSPNFFL